VTTGGAVQREPGQHVLTGDGAERASVGDHWTLVDPMLGEAAERASLALSVDANVADPTGLPPRHRTCFA
jgi:hypothetical protein